MDDMEEGELEDLGVMRLEEVLEFCGISRSLVYSMMAAGEFPEQVRLSQRAVGWLRREVRAWVRSRPRSRGSGPGEIQPGSP